MRSALGHRIAIALVALAAGLACQDGSSRDSEGPVSDSKPAVAIVLSEIMYRPLRSEQRERFDGRNFGPYIETDDDRALEYLELFNASDRSIDLGGWRISDGVSYTFAHGVRLDAGDYLVVAVDPEALAARQQVVALGPFNGRLANRGERVALSDASGAVVDEVTYASRAPWPIASVDLGHSLERVALQDPRSSVENWRASRSALAFPMAGAGTPGAANSVAQAAVPPFISALTHAPEAPVEGEPVVVTARVVADQAPASVTLELIRDGRSTTMAMQDDGEHGDGASSDARYGVILAGQPAGTLTHYRVHVGDDSSYPYDTDPSPTRAFYHAASRPGSAPRYHLFIEGDVVERLRAAAEQVPREDREERATIVIEGKAHPNVLVSLTGRHGRAWEPFAWQLKLNPDSTHLGLTSLRTSPRLPLEQDAIFKAFSRVGLPGLGSEVVELQVTTSGVAADAIPYLVYEVPNSAWLERTGYSEATEVYKARSVESASPRRNSDLFYFGDPGDERAENGHQTDANYLGAYAKERRPFARPTHIRNLVAALNQLPDEELLPWLDANVDVNSWLTAIALHLYLRIDDFAGHNYYLLLPDGFGGKWQVISYDFDSFARFEPLPLFYGSGLDGESPDWQRNKLHQRIRTNPTLSRIYLLLARNLLWRHPPDELVPPEMVAPVAEARRAMQDELQRANLPAPEDAPVLDPCGGAAASASVSVPSGWDVYFTLDGSDPRLSRTRSLAQGAVAVPSGAVLRAAAAESGYPLSAGRWTDAVRCVYANPSP